MTRRDIGLAAFVGASLARPCPPAPDTAMAFCFIHPRGTAAATIAGGTADTLGAPPWASRLASFGAGLAASVGWDKGWFHSHRAKDLVDDGAKQPLQLVSNTGTHEGVTYEAAREAGFSDFEARVITAANLARDRNLWSNEDHFDSLAKRTFERLREEALKRESESFVGSLGAASHHLQDQYALGHMFPGTHLFKGPLGAPIRGLIHQIVGGEVTLQEAQFRATLRLFQTAKTVTWT